MLKILFQSPDQTLSHYSSLLEQLTKFELVMGIESLEEKINYLSKLFFNSRNVRQGPQPGIEQQANILKTIRNYVMANEPIPVLIPSGPKKTKNGESIDLAELSIIKILMCLNKTAKAVYGPGFIFIVRLEDNTGNWLEGNTIEVTSSMDNYIRDFYLLVSILGVEKEIVLYRESAWIKPDIFRNKAHENAEVILAYLKATPFGKEPTEDMWEYKRLKEIGWKGLIPLEMRTYYELKYQKLYPNASYDFIINMMAKYMGGTLARHQLGGVGTELYKEKGCLEIGIATPTPGVPESMFSARVYYRTMTLANTKRHMPYWRAKGIFKIDENDQVRMSLLNWSEIKEVNLIEGHLTFSNEYESINIKADCIL